MGTVVLRFDPARARDLLAVLKASDLAIESRPNTLAFARRPGLTVTLYATGKALLQGPTAEEFANYLEHGSHGLALAPLPPKGVPPPSAFARRIGSDESGKGDYFGPLTVAAVAILDPSTEAELRESRIRDSKTMTDETALLLGSVVAARAPHEVVAVVPRAYNAAVDGPGGANGVLARAHADAIERLLARHPDVRLVTVDRFARGPRLADALGGRGRAVEVREIERAESADLAVAAASVLARAEFLRHLEGMRARWGAAFPKGAGSSVVSAARAFAEEHGPEALGEVAKVHFATTREVLGAGP